MKLKFCITLLHNDLINDDIAIFAGRVALGAIILFRIVYNLF